MQLTRSDSLSSLLQSTRVRLLALGLSIGLLSFLSAALLVLAYDPSHSRARREELITGMLPLWIPLTIAGAMVGTYLGVARRGWRAHLLGRDDPLINRALRVLFLGASLGAVVPAVQSAMGGSVPNSLSRTMFESPWTTAVALLGILSMAVQEEAALRTTVFEVVRRGCAGRSGRERARLATLAATVGVLIVVGLTHMGSSVPGSASGEFLYALVPRLLPSIVIVWIYVRYGLIEACLLHAAMNYCAFVLLPGSYSLLS